MPQCLNTSSRVMILRRGVPRLIFADKKILLNKKINSTLEEMARTIYMHKFFRKSSNGKLGDLIIENPNSTISVNAAKVTGNDFPFFTSGKNILRWNVAQVDGRNIFLTLSAIPE